DVLPQVPDAFWDKMLEMAKPEALADLVIPVYVKHYSDEDVMELIRFYKTPVGKKVIEKMPLVLQECLAIGGKWGEKIAQDIIEKLKAEGYTKDEGGE
ncbi:MAG: DUF2059 domain-containing protein, partial [Chitinophagaceae bacterium]|nr:DUF2059 domain-containing protein [Chitinophagaceae bacterium]